MLQQHLCLRRTFDVYISNSKLCKQNSLCQRQKFVARLEHIPKSIRVSNCCKEWVSRCFKLVCTWTLVSNAMPACPNMSQHVPMGGLSRMRVNGTRTKTQTQSASNVFRHWARIAGPPKKWKHAFGTVSNFMVNQVWGSLISSPRRVPERPQTSQCTALHQSCSVPGFSAGAASTTTSCPAWRRASTQASLVCSVPHAYQPKKTRKAGEQWPNSGGLSRVTWRSCLVLSESTGCVILIQFGRCDQHLLVFTQTYSNCRWDGVQKHEGASNDLCGSYYGIRQKLQVSEALCFGVCAKPPDTFSSLHKLKWYKRACQEPLAHLALPIQNIHKLHSKFELLSMEGLTR